MRYLVLSLVCLACVIAYVQRTALSVPTKTIQADLKINEQQMGLVMACWFWAYALLQIPAGWVTDRIGSKWALILFVTAWSLLTGLAGFAHDYFALLALWSLMGLAQTGLVPGAAKAVGVWFSPTGRAFGSGMIASSMGVGTAVASVVAGWLLFVLLVSWREMLGLYVLPGVAWAILFALIVPGGRDPPPPAPPPEGTFERMVRSPPMLLLCAQQFFRAAAMALFFTWFPRFLQETFGLTEFESGKLAFWPGVGVVVGGILGGMSSDALLKWTRSRRLSRQGIAVAGMICCAALSLSAYFADNATTAIVLITLAAFAGTFGGVSGYSVCIDFGGRRVGTVISVMNMCGNVGAGVFPLVVGFIVAQTGNWTFVLPLFAGIFAIDAVCWAFLNPTRPLFEDDDGSR